MKYPKFEKDISQCAECNKVVEYHYTTVRDNNMIVNFFQFEDGRDNIFCDSQCLADYLSAEEICAEKESAE